MSAPEVSIPAFLPYYLHLVPRARLEAELAPLIRPVAGEGRDEALLDTVWTGLTAVVELHSFRTLIGAFHAFRERLGLPAAKDGDAALLSFTEHLAEPAHCRELLDRYPVLRDRLTVLLDNSLAAYADFFTAYATDRAELRAAGLLPQDGGGDLLDGFFLTGSDLHNDSRQVIGVRLSGGGRLVFKPRSLATDDFVRDIYAAAEPYLCHPLRRCLPASVSLRSHGWQQFTAPEPMTEPGQVDRYYYRFGALCALFGAIGATDLHDENVLACGEHPCVIDTETMVRPDPGQDPDGLPGVLTEHLKHSIASTMLVPMVNPKSPIDVVMAGVGVAGDQQSSMNRPRVRDAGTDAIGVAWEKVTYRHGGNVPRLADTPLHAVDHFPAVRDGYADALRCIRDGRLAKVLDGAPDLPVRILLRSTMVYGKYVDASTHPDYLARAEEAERLLGLLGRHSEQLTPAAGDFAVAAERRAISRGDVPYFRARAGSTELGTAREAHPDAYRINALDYARRGIELSAERPDAYHHFLLEECFAELAGEDRPAGLSAAGLFGGTLRDDPGWPVQPGGWWPAIARLIEDIGVPYAGPGGRELGWVCGTGPGSEGMTLTPGAYVAFHDNGGIVPFLRRAAALDPAVGPAHEAADRGLSTLLVEYDEGLLRHPASMFSGAASVLLVRPQAIGAERLHELLDRIEEQAADGSLDTDMANGPAGLLMALLSADLAPGARDGIGRLHDLVLEHLHAPRTARWYDLAHGELGLRWACARVGAHTGDARLVREQADWLAERYEAEEQPPYAGWCKGWAGLLTAGAEIMTAAGRPDWFGGGRLDELIRKATSLPLDRSVDLSVCHGSSGVVQSLLAAGRLLGEGRRLTAAARAYQERVIATAGEHGFCTGAPGRSSLLGYMLGWSGVGDTDALLHAHEADPDGTPAAFPVPVALDCGGPTASDDQGA
ncbi:DUF4135 domain-containing protein [Streptomyces boninensis]|uniref:DUF4135 domain-containing protein n=1 Tax=Streptomyces boninensis TaxID=2039455 RepID=UPI003B215424